MTIEVFFDCSSPWSYLGFEGVQPLAAEFGVALVWRPVLVGGIFNAVNSSVYHIRDQVPVKSAYNVKDLADWSLNTGLAITFPPPVFPVNSARAMRLAILLADEGLLVPFALAIYRRYFGNGEDISDPAVLADTLVAIGAAADTLMAQSDTPEVRSQLRANTEEAIERGAFGVPTFYLDGSDMYFGVDRLPNLRRALERRAKRL